MHAIQNTHLQNKHDLYDSRNNTTNITNETQKKLTNNNSARQKYDAENTHALLLLAFLLELEYARPSLASASREAAVSAASNDDEDDGDASRC
jgi:hypothetical protein